MAHNEGEDENYWPGYVDALTTMTMVLTFIMMVLGITVFSLSKNVSRQLLEAMASATNVSTKGSTSEQLRDTVLNEVAKLTKERDELRRQLEATKIPQPGPLRPDAQPGPPRQSEELVASPITTDPQPVLPDRQQGTEVPPEPGKVVAAAAPVRPVVLPSEIADAATQSPPSVAAPARGGSQVDIGSRAALPLTANTTTDPRHENAARTPADLINNPPFPPPEGEARVTLPEPAKGNRDVPAAGGAIAGLGTLDAAAGNPDPATHAADPAGVAADETPGRSPSAGPKPAADAVADAMLDRDNRAATETPVSPETKIAALDPQAMPADTPRGPTDEQTSPPPRPGDAKGNSDTRAGAPDPKPRTRPDGAAPRIGEGERDVPGAAAQRATGPTNDARPLARLAPTEIDSPEASQAGGPNTLQPIQPSPDADQHGGPSDPVGQPAFASQDIRSGAPPSVAERSAGAKVTSSPVLMTVSFAPRATALDTAAKAAIDAFATQMIAQAGDKFVLVRGLADAQQAGVTEQRRAAYYRALVVRQELIQRGVHPEKIATRIEFVAPGEKPDIVEVRLR